MNLTSVDLLGTENSKLTGDGLVPLIVNNPSLERLRVVFSPTTSAYYRPTTDVFRALSKNCPKLTYLALLPWESLYGIGDTPILADPMEEKSIALLVRGCPLLKYLYVPCADGHVLHQLAHHARNLRGFGVIHPELFEEGTIAVKHWQAVHALNTACPSLCSLVFANTGTKSMLYEQLFYPTFSMTSLHHLTIIDGTGTHNPSFQCSAPPPDLRTIRVLYGHADYARVASRRQVWFQRGVDDHFDIHSTATRRTSFYDTVGAVYHHFRSSESQELCELTNCNTTVFTCATMLRYTTASLLDPLFYKAVRLLEFPYLQHIYHERNMLVGEFDFLCNAAPNIRTCLFVERARILSQDAFGSFDERTVAKALKRWPKLIAVALSDCKHWPTVIRTLRAGGGGRLRSFVACIPSDVNIETALMDLVSVCPLLSFIWIYHNSQSLPDPSNEFLARLHSAAPHLVAVCPESPTIAHIASTDGRSRLLSGIRLLCHRDADISIRSKLQFVPENLCLHPEELFDHDAHHPHIVYSLSCTGDNDL